MNTKSNASKIPKNPPIADSEQWNGKPGRGKSAHAIHLRESMRVSEGRVSYVIEPREVRVVAVGERWAMVRRPGAMPYVCPLKDLRNRTSKDA